ncbi:hypothetical protein HZ326_19119 [Fusarium oxysporum f. sp. albedinis]|nr:hypothetical protein HZ326_19119 [Fusarium oxysporum f. sp. albedinis]
MIVSHSIFIKKTVSNKFTTYHLTELSECDAISSFPLDYQALVDFNEHAGEIYCLSRYLILSDNQFFSLTGYRPRSV